MNTYWPIKWYSIQSDSQAASSAILKKSNVNSSSVLILVCLCHHDSVLGHHLVGRGPRGALELRYQEDDSL